MWTCPCIPSVEEALQVQFNMHQKKYGRSIVPDQQLSDFRKSIEQLDDTHDGRVCDDFSNKINADGWKTVTKIFSKHEAMLVAIMSLAAQNFAPIRNRHNWSNRQESKQNRCVFMILFVHSLNCLQGNGICQTLAH